MNKEQLKRGDVIECGGITAYVVNPNYKDNYVKVILNNKCNALLNKDWLSIWRPVNPIKDNRIVSNETFALRLKNFIEDTNVNDACSFEEKEYLLSVANQLLKYQIQTATEKNEIDYLKRVGVYGKSNS